MIFFYIRTIYFYLLVYLNPEVGVILLSYSAFHFQDGGPHSHLIAVCRKPPETWWMCGVGGA